MRDACLTHRAMYKTSCQLRRNEDDMAVHRRLGQLQLVGGDEQGHQVDAAELQGGLHLPLRVDQEEVARELPCNFHRHSWQPGHEAAVGRRHEPGHRVSASGGGVRLPVPLRGHPLPLGQGCAATPDPQRHTLLSRQLMCRRASVAGLGVRHLVICRPYLPAAMSHATPSCTSLALSSCCGMLPRIPALCNMKTMQAVYAVVDFKCAWQAAAVCFKQLTEARFS